MGIDKDGIWRESPIHIMFGLTYANYAIFPRVLLEAMPHEWQVEFCKLLEELHDTFDHDAEYWVRKKRNGKFVSDPLSNYRRPNKEYIESIRIAER